jgi:hypothetical protein
MPTKVNEDGVLRCTKCDRLMKLGSEFFGWEPPKPNGPPDWPVHVWNGSVICNGDLDASLRPQKEAATNG